MALAIYQRLKVEGNWRYKPVATGRGKRTGGLSGPFYIRPTIRANGVRKQPWLALDASDFDAAMHEAETRSSAFEAKAKGLTVAEANAGNADRLTLRNSVDHFLQEKADAGCTPGTLQGYTQKLEEFLQLIPPQIRFIDQMVETETRKGFPKRTSSTLKEYMRQLQANGASARTVFNKMEVVIFMLKEAGVPNPSKLITVPPYEDEEAVPYTKADLQKLFNVMDDDEKFLFTFFLDTACRKGEVAHATLLDIYDGKYHVRAKTYKDSDGRDRKYTVKTHEDRRVPLTRELQSMIEERRKKATGKWLFPNKNGNPENDNGFIRQLKRAAKRAGLICGQCQSELKKTDRYGKNPHVETVWCADDCLVCEQHYLHRFRKTRATFWHEQSVPMRTIQKWLGHKSLETTERYLGTKDSAELQHQINKPMY
jgi:integrase